MGFYSVKSTRRPCGFSNDAKFKKCGNMEDSVYAKGENRCHFRILT